MADMISLAILAIVTGFMSFFVPNSFIPLPMWLFIYIFWATCALFVWHHPNAPKHSQKWLLIAFYSLIGAPFWFGLVSIAAHVFFPSGEPTLSKTFDIVATMLLTPGLTLIALIGWVRKKIKAP